MIPTALRRGLAACALIAALPGSAGALTVGAGAWAARLAEAPVEDFGAARLGGRGVEAPRARLAPMAAGEVLPGIPAGGALGLIHGGLPGVRGAAVSTRDLGWPYAFVIELPHPAAAIDLVWAGANADWRVSARAPDGTLLGRALAPGFEAERSPFSGGAGSPQGRLTLSLSRQVLAGRGGLSRLEFESLGGYDWLAIDDLRAAEIHRAPLPALVLAAPGTDPLETVPAVPLPVPAVLLAGALAALAGLARRRAARR